MMRLRISSLLIAVVLLLSVVLPTTAQVYPLKNAPTLTYWMNVNTAWSNRFKTLGDTTFGLELAKRTGVNVVYTHPVPAQFDQSFNLMLASGDLPDLIQNNFLTKIPGGPDKAIKDGYLLRLNEAIAKWAPNLTAYLKAHPEVDKLVKSDEGNYYAFPFIRTDPYLMTYQGPIVRQDWLDELKLPVPVTIDDWTVMLKAFKEKKGATAPFAMAPYWGPTNAAWQSPAFVGAYGTLKNWYIDNGKVKFGPSDTQYKEFLKLFAGWYKAGLIDPNFALSDAKQRDAIYVAGMSGATVANIGGGIGYLVKLMEKVDPKARFVAAPYPVLKKSDKPEFGQMDLPFTGVAIAISAKTKNLETAVRYLDYGYSPDGAMFYNFGTPGVSYNMVGGYPTYTDFIMKNAKLSLQEAMGEHIRGSSDGPFLQDKRYAEQYFLLPEQKAAATLWSSTNAAKHLFPNLSPDKADIAEMSKIMSEVNTYVDEAFIKFVIGAEPVENFDKYLATLKQLKIDRAIAIYQKSYDDFLKR
ncbi:MAG: extracellular solute-binding protein [Spirochaetales bacterium]